MPLLLSPDLLCVIHRLLLYGKSNGAKELHHCPRAKWYLSWQHPGQQEDSQILLALELARDRLSPVGNWKLDPVTLFWR